MEKFVLMCALSLRTRTHTHTHTHIPAYGTAISNPFLPELLSNTLRHIYGTVSEDEMDITGINWTILGVIRVFIITI
jgi:hypothetical protein